MRENRGDCHSCKKAAWLDVHKNCVFCTHKDQHKEILPDGVSAIPINEPSLACTEVRKRAIEEDKIKNKYTYEDKEAHCLDIVAGCFKRRN